MRGIAQGEASSGSNPLLQLYCRQGQLLTTPASASYLIQDISVSPAVTKASGNFNLASVALGGHLLGPGRLAIPASTAAIVGPPAVPAWTVGTHRVACTFAMTLGGAAHKQVQDFEVLDPIEFAAGYEYMGLASSKELIASALFGSLTAGQLQPYIHQASMLVEQLLGNVLEPRYMTLIFSGESTYMHFLNVPIIAIEKIESVSEDSSGAVTRYEWPSYLWRAYNRHLDGLQSPDDRCNPKIELVTHDPGSVTRSEIDWMWPYGQQNLEISGVFGYTDPSPNPALPGVSIGRAPRDLARAIIGMAYKIRSDPAAVDPTAISGSVKSYRTDAQSVTFASISPATAPTGGLYITGDQLVDQILHRFLRPIEAAYDDRRDNRIYYRYT